MTQAFLSAQEGDVLVTKSETKRNMKVYTVNRDTETSQVKSIGFQRINKNGSTDQIVVTKNAIQLSAMSESGQWALRSR